RDPLIDRAAGLALHARDHRLRIGDARMRVVLTLRFLRHVLPSMSNIRSVVRIAHDTTAAASAKQALAATMRRRLAGPMPSGIILSLNAAHNHMRGGERDRSRLPSA